MANTPSNRLERLCSVNNREVTFFDDASGPSHQPVFTVTATVGQFTATACDSVKKRAKHKACNELLKYVVQESREKPDSWSHIDFHIEGWDYETEIKILEEQSSASKEWRSLFNSIGALSEYCAKRKIPLPKFEDKVLSVHPPHFKYICYFNVLKDTQGNALITEAEADTKKVAKKRAADLMYELLQKNGHISDGDNGQPDHKAQVGESNCLQEENKSNENLENSSSNHNMQIEANINAPIEVTHDCDDGNN